MTDDIDEGGQLVRLPVSEGKRDRNVEQAQTREAVPALVPPRDYSERHCSHMRVTLDTKNRRCVCGCGQIIEAYDFLVKLSHHWEREMQMYHDMKRERAEISARLVDLRREENNTKSRLRTARKSLGRVERAQTIDKLGVDV